MRRKSGIGLLGLGVLHSVLSGYLSTLWGVIWIVLGLVSLLVPRHGVVLVSGIAPILVGLWNLGGAMLGIDGLSGWTYMGACQSGWERNCAMLGIDGLSGWTYMGACQIGLGAMEVAKFASGDLLIVQHEDMR